MRFGVFIYPGVEPIDLATFGVLSMARRIAPEIAICTIAPEAGRVTLANGLVVEADHGVADAPPVDWLIITGGPGWTAQCEADATLGYLREAARTTRIASVCTGAMILAAAGLLDGLPATTKREVVPPETPPIDALRVRHPAVRVREATLVETGRDRGVVLTGGGVALGIDATLHVLRLALGDRVADETARIVEYRHAAAANAAALPVVTAPMLASGQSSVPASPRASG